MSTYRSIGSAERHTAMPLTCAARVQDRPFGLNHVTTSAAFGDHQWLSALAKPDARSVDRREVTT